MIFYLDDGLSDTVLIVSVDPNLKVAVVGAATEKNIFLRLLKTEVAVQGPSPFENLSS